MQCHSIKSLELSLCVISTLAFLQGSLLGKQRQGVVCKKG